MRINLISTSPIIYKINSKRKRNVNGKRKTRTCQKKYKVSLASETRHMSHPPRRKPKILKHHASQSYRGQGEGPCDEVLYA